MEREILFRGKPMFRESDDFVYGYYKQDDIAGIKTDFILPLPEYKNEINEVAVCPLTVGRFTGLTDKNGRKIFEGDILQRNNNPKDIVQVVFGKFPVIDMETESEVDKVIGWYCDVIPTDALSKTLPFCLPMPLTDYYINQCNAEVVGNIHDNPELLKGET